ncbi:MAG TPA: hypothetical protein VNO30_42825 [Kofleriaceae bacterium]|nr:hypothetical protein [Kofleriaceae bacterium]
MRYDFAHRGLRPTDEGRLLRVPEDRMVLPILIATLPERDNIEQ